MARAISDVPEYPVRSTVPNLSILPFKIQFLGGTINTASGTTQLPLYMTFSSKTATGKYKFVIPAALATKYWVTARTTGNTIVTLPSADTLVPTGFLEFQTGTTAATTATDPADGIILTGAIYLAWGR